MIWFRVSFILFFQLVWKCVIHTLIFTCSLFLLTFRALYQNLLPSLLNMSLDIHIYICVGGILTNFHSSKNCYCIKKKYSSRWTLISPQKFGDNVQYFFENKSYHLELRRLIVIHFLTCISKLSSIPSTLLLFRSVN